MKNSPDSSVDLGHVSTDMSTPEEGDIRMRLNPYDELERQNIRAGIFEVDSSRTGTAGEDFLRKVRGHWQLRKKKQYLSLIVCLLPLRGV